MLLKTLSGSIFTFVPIFLNDFRIRFKCDWMIHNCAIFVYSQFLKEIKQSIIKKVLKIKNPYVFWLVAVGMDKLVKCLSGFKNRFWIKSVHGEILLFGTLLLMGAIHGFAF